MNTFLTHEVSLITLRETLDIKLHITITVKNP